MAPVGEGCSTICGRDGPETDSERFHFLPVACALSTFAGISTVTFAVGCGGWAKAARKMRTPRLRAMPGRSSCCARRCRQKIIGDLLGHRSTEATIPYLKLATEDLRRSRSTCRIGGAVMTAWMISIARVVARPLLGKVGRLRSANSRAYYRQVLHGFQDVAERHLPINRQTLEQTGSGKAESHWHPSHRFATVPAIVDRFLDHLVGWVDHF